jgi:type I restriction enzyme, S subunit
VSAVLDEVITTAQLVPLSQAVEVNPKIDRTALHDDLDVSFVPMAAVEALSGGIDVSTARKYGEVKKGYTHFRDGDILFAKVTPCMENGKMAIARKLVNGVGFGSTEFHVLRPRAGVDARYVYYFVSSQTFRKEASGHMTGAVGLRRVPSAYLEEQLIALPGIEKQRKIVAELEKQFSRLDEAVANLQRVKANLKRYKASVLKDAVEGRLVPTEAEQARREGRSFETGEQLLQRILETRRKRWSGRGKYVESDLSMRTGLPDLPAGWTWAPFGVMGKDPFNTVQTGPFGAQLHNTDFTPYGVPVIAVGNLTGTGFRRDGLYFISQEKADQLARYDVWSGDILFARSGATLGKVCVAPVDVSNWRMTGHILRARLNVEFLRSEIALYALAALPSVTKQIFGSVRGVTRPGFNTSLLESIWIPIPPLAEQQRIVAEVDSRVSLLAGVEAQVDANLKRAQSLRQATLSQAFSVHQTS